MADIDALKDIPGYKAILKSILKSQIQLLIEQLSNQTGEETIILTASVHDGTLSHLGSNTGKGFLEGRDEIKSQFLGYCLKTHHKPKTPEARSSPYQRPSPRPKSPTLQPGPSKRQKVHPVSLISRQPQADFQPRPSPRPQQRQSVSDINTGLADPSSNDSGELREVLVKQEAINAPASDTEQTEAVEFVGDDSFSSNSMGGNSAQLPSTIQLSHTQTSASNHGDTEQSDDLGQGDFENSNDQSGIKVEPITENEMELEITGVEMGEGQMAGSEAWGQGQDYGAEGSDVSFNQEGGEQSGYKVKVKRRRQYSLSNMKRALQLVREGVPKRQASKLCGVPRSTLIDKLTGRRPLDVKSGVKKVLSDEEEENLAGEILLLRQMGCQMDKKQIQQKVKQLIDKDGRKNPFKDNLPGKDWYYSFVQRHPELKDTCNIKITDVISLNFETSSADSQDLPDVTSLKPETLTTNDLELPELATQKSETLSPNDPDRPTDQDPVA